MKNIVFNILYYLGIAKSIRRSKFRKKEITVLSLHRIHPDSEFAWNPIHPKTFELLLQYVQQHYQLTTFAQLSQDLEKSSKPLLILSFDDGYKDFMEYALPLLERYQVPCNHNFVIACLDNNTPIWTQELNHIFNHLYERKEATTLHFGEKTYVLSSNLSTRYGIYIRCLQDMLATPKALRLAQIEAWKRAFSLPATPVAMMDWSDLKRCLSSNLVEIGSHTATHDSLATIADETTLAWELQSSKQRLEQELGIPIPILALPNGQSSDTIRQQAAQAGYQFLLEINERYYQHQNNDTFHIVSRINIVEEAAIPLYLRIENVQNKLKSWLR